MKLGISSYAFTWAIGVSDNIPENPLDHNGLYEKANNLGVTRIQIADNLPLDKLSEPELVSFANKVKRHGMQLEVGARGMTEATLRKYIEIAKRFESPVLRFVIDGPDYAPDIKDIVNIIKNAVPVLEVNNIILALENYERFKTHQFASIIEEVGNEHVGICLDTVNSVGAGESIDSVICILGPLAVNLHIKEFIIKRSYHRMGYIIEGLPCGDGMLNLPLLLKNVSERCNSAILEQWVPPEENLMRTIQKEQEWAVKSVAYLKEFFD